MNSIDRILQDCIRSFRSSQKQLERLEDEQTKLEAMLLTDISAKQVENITYELSLIDAQISYWDGIKFQSECTMRMIAREKLDVPNPTETMLDNMINDFLAEDAA